VNGWTLEHAPEYAVEELNTATDNARTLLPLMEDEIVQAYHQNQDIVTHNLAQCTEPGMNGENMKYAANPAEEASIAEADNAQTLLLLMEEEAVLVYRQSQKFATCRLVQQEIIWWM